MQEITATPSRHAQPRAWLRAVTWLIGAGLHPKASARTLAVARDLAARMDYTRGLVLYDLDGTAGRLGVHRATVKRHVAVLRQLGALAWHRHGTRANLHLPGRPYASTATIYAATIPAAYDHAMGHRINGTGYEVRVIGVTQEGRERAIAEARTAARPVENVPVENRRSTDRAPHSLGGSPNVRKAEVSGGWKDTPRRRAARSRTSTPHRTSRRGPRRHPLQVARDITIARHVRPLVPWTQRETLRRLAYALRPLIDRGLDAREIAAELHGMAMSWRPAQPAAYISAHLAQAREHETALRRERAAREAAARPAGNAAWAHAVQQFRDTLAAAEPERTDTDRRRARLHGWQDWEQVAEHYEDDPDDALDLYGRKLLEYAVGRAARAAPW